jgi:uncharacterized protein (TIRG00374 family)
METKLNNVEKIETGQILKRLISVATRVVISAIILYFVVSLVTWQNVISAYQSANGRYILFGGLLLIVNLGIRTLKWRIMLHSVKNKSSLWEAFGSVMLGISFGSFTPGEIGDFAGRALHISDARKSHLVGLALLDKAQIFVVTSAAGAISLVFLLWHDSFFIIPISFIIVFLSLVFFMRMDLLAVFGHRLNASFFQKSWVTRVLDGFTLLKSQQLFTTLLCTLLFHAVLILQMFYFIHAFGEITLFHAFIGTSAMMFVKSCLPISLGDLGIREAGSVFFFSTFGVSQAAALNASLLLFVVNVLFPSICGTIFLKHQHVTAWTIFRSLLSKSKAHPHD